MVDQVAGRRCAAETTPAKELVGGWVEVASGAWGCLQVVGSMALGHRPDRARQPDRRNATAPWLRVGLEECTAFGDTREPASHRVILPFFALLGGSQAMARVANETSTISASPQDRPNRIVTVPDRFLSRFWAVLVSVLLHPFSTTIIRVTPPESEAA